VTDKPADQPGLAPLPVTTANTPVIPDEMETPQADEAEEAREEPPVQVDRPTLKTQPAAPPVQLERSQRTRAPPPFLCDEVDNPPTVIIKEIWGTSN